MSGFVVAFFVPHNEGVVSGIIDDAAFDFDSGLTLVDLYEVDATIKALPDRAAAEAWLGEKYAGLDITNPPDLAGAMHGYEYDS